jgi:molybdopterin molybdotransferase
MITAAEASAIILRHTPRMPFEAMPLMQALGSVASDDIVATITHPPWRNASMDGYAVRAQDITTTPVALRVVDHVVAGRFPSREIGPGEAAKVMTGAPVPNGADSVIRFEDTSNGTRIVEIYDMRDLGRNVRPLGEDFRTGDLLLGAGSEITSAAVGLLASAGIQTVNAYRRPTIAVISSGDELVMLDRFDHVLRGERIVSSNSYTLPALVRDTGGVPYDFGIAADSEESIRQRIDAARGCDLIITSAGISVGEHDYTRSAMASLGVDLKFWKVQIHPGAPLAFGTLDGTPWIGLSGNPVSAMVTFELFVRPAIHKMRGYNSVFPISFPVKIVEPIITQAPLMHFLRAVVMTDQSGLARARLTGTQSSAALSSMVTANALLVIPPDRQHIPAGEILKAIPFGGSILRGQEFPV